MNVDRLVEFLQTNAQALMVFASSRFKTEYLNQLNLAEDDKAKIRLFIQLFFDLVKNATEKLEFECSLVEGNEWSSFYLLLLVLSYSIDNGKKTHINEENNKKAALKNFIQANEPIYSYLDENLDDIGKLFDKYDISVFEHTNKLIPWLSDNADFIAASLEPNFSLFIQTLPAEQQDVVKKYSDFMKKIFMQYIRQPNILLTDIAADAIFDPMDYYLTRIKLLSSTDAESNQIGKNDLEAFFAINPQLECFMAFETKKLEPIVALWRAAQLNNSTSRITSVLTSRESNTLPSSPKAQSTSSKRKVGENDDDDDSEHTSHSAFTGPVVKRPTKAAAPSSDDSSVTSSTLVNSIQVKN
jgi:hypothetical protein